ncbi:hypothetical protein [Streptomyces bobili]|uniref:hypothetical protein n=1 Tax=Streptomyces bobili TaxID=67280 RepID=UPI0038277974
MKHLASVSVIGLTLITTGCSTESSNRPSSPRTQTISAYAMIELETACFINKDFPDNDAYNGGSPGIHPALLTISKMPNHSELSRDFELYNKKWLLDYSADPKKVQIIFCVNRTDGKMAKGQKCKIPSSGKTLPAYDATYRIRAIEARTGKQIKEWSKQADFAQCPSRLTEADKASKKYYADIPKDQLHALLEELITP